MGNNFSLNRLSEYIERNVKKIGDVRKEVEEIQVGFNSAYVEWKAEHDATLERLTEVIVDRLEEVGPELQGVIRKQLAVEKENIASYRQKLRQELIPETQTEADVALAEGKQLTQKLRQLNPRLDKREEKLKAQRVSLEGNLAQLNQQMRELSGCLGVVIHFPKINKLDRQRQQVIGKLDALQQDLKEVREEWQSSQHQIQEEQEALQARWQAATLKLAQLQGELAFLDDEASREALARSRAARHVIDNLKEPIPCSIQDLAQELGGMVKLNLQTDDYQEGLGSVGSLMSLLDGITEGLTRFHESVEGLISEQKMHSAYLPKLDVSIPKGVVAFHEMWDGLRDKVRDDGHLCKHPVEFVAAIRPVLDEGLSEANVKAMFDGLGGALKHATKAWRG